MDCKQATRAQFPAKGLCHIKPLRTIISSILSRESIGNLYREKPPNLRDF